MVRKRNEIQLGRNIDNTQTAFYVDKNPIMITNSEKIHLLLQALRI